ncbi:hypothetical protein B0T22DRAFT_53131 [Podospora appendiculata]|uniref:Uncharacterized protein n=1 Tax=Podospora appendiculata TaxID=314037 RepID=A0AAE0XIC5_9PEZI|nr:hypothetical protein B0T22DRAFT_53131 [Podospora appendiculata]
MEYRESPTMSAAGSRRGSDTGSFWTTGAESHDTTDDKVRHKSGGKGGKGGLFRKVNNFTDWLATSEPSAQAYRQHKKETFRKAGISLDDDRDSAKAKLHAPTGEIPKDVIRPNMGPSPEEVVRKKAEERRRAKQPSSGGPAGSQKSRSSMSGFSSTSTSSRKGSVTFADDDFPCDNRRRVPHYLRPKNTMGANRTTRSIHSHTSFLPGPQRIKKI